MTIDEVVSQYKQLESRLEEINKAVKDLKERSGYREVQEHLKPLKEYLFKYMDENQMKELMGVKKAKVKPAAVKREEREERMSVKVEMVLEQELGEQPASELTPLIVQAII